MKLFLYSLREFDELEPAKKWSREYGIEFDYCTEYPNLENAALAEGYDCVSATPCDMGEAMVRRFHALGVRHLAARSIGFDHIDLKTAKALGMRVSNTCYEPDGVANYTIMLMLMATRKMAHILKRAEAQDYTLCGKLGRDISACTVGVIGTGKIGATVVRNLAGFGCKILAYDLYPNAQLAVLCEYVDLQTLYARADVITLHTPATAESHHMLNHETLAQMKPGVILINCARGAVIDTEALICALESGQVGGAALDVLEQENGLYYENRMGDVIENRQMAILRAFPSVILSPHTAFYTDENVDNMVKYNFESLFRFKNGQDDPRQIKL